MKTTKHTKQVGAVSDRGLIKWQGMLLTEHVRLIKAFYEEQDQVPKPELTEFDLQILQEDLEVAMKRKSMVKLKTWKDKRVYEHIGVFDSVDGYGRCAYYSDSDGRKRVPIDEIISLELLD